MKRLGSEDTPGTMALWHNGSRRSMDSFLSSMHAAGTVSTATGGRKDSKGYASNAVWSSEEASGVLLVFFLLMWIDTHVTFLLFSFLFSMITTETNCFCLSFASLNRQRDLSIHG